MNWVKGVSNFFFGQGDGGSSAKGEQQQAAAAAGPKPAGSTYYNAGSSQPSTSSAPSSGFKRSVRQASAQNGNAAPRPQPLLQDAGPRCDGGVQSLSWYARKQRQDEDGSVADTFYVESESGKKGMLRKNVRKLPQPAPVEVLMVDRGNVVLSH